MENYAEQATGVWIAIQTVEGFKSHNPGDKDILNLVLEGLREEYNYLQEVAASGE